MASGISFEVDLGAAYVPHYGTAPISARMLFRKIADGAGHLSDHYDLGRSMCVARARAVVDGDYGERPLRHRLFAAPSTGHLCLSRAM